MSVLRLLEAEGPLLLLGTGVLLGLGTLWLLLTRAPAHRQRIGELTVVVCLLWAVLALLPLPRLTLLQADGAGGSPQGEGLLRAEQIPYESLQPVASAPRLALSRPALSAPRPAQSPAYAPEPPREVPRHVLPGDPARAQPSPATGGPASQGASALPLLFLVGALACLLYQALGILGLRRILVRTRAPSPELLRLAKDLPAIRGGPARIRISARPCRPFCAGFLRSLIVLPARLDQPRAAATARAVLLHEIAHLRRRDSLGNLLFLLALPLLYPQPLYWLVRRRVRFDAELLADDQAAAWAGKRDYVLRMIRLAESEPLPRAAALATPAVIHSTSDFTRRIEMLLERPDRLLAQCSSRRRWLQGVAALVILVAASALLGTPLAAAQEPAPRPSASPQEAPSSRLARMKALAAEVDALRARVAELQAQLKATEMGRRLPTENEWEAAARASKPALPGVSHGVRYFPAGTPPVQLVPVCAGDTLASLARRHSLTPDQIRILNPELDPRKLRVGQKIKIPGVVSGRNAAAEPEPEPDTQPAPASRVLDARDLDLLTRSIDLQGEVELAKVELSRIAQLVESAAASKSELLRAEVQYRTASRKLALTRALIESEIGAVEADLANLLRRLSQLTDAHPAKRASRPAIMRLEARLKLLRSALQ